MCVCSVAFTYALEHPSVSGDIKNIVVKKLGNFNIYQLMFFDTPQGKLNGFTWADLKVDLSLNNGICIILWSFQEKGLGWDDTYSSEK